MDKNFFKEIVENADHTITLEESMCYEETTADELFENTLPLSEAKINMDKIGMGDIILVNSFVKSASNEIIDNKDHRVLVIYASNENNVKKREYYGYGMSSNIKQATIINPARKKTALIADYKTILRPNTRATAESKPIIINTNDVVKFTAANMAQGKFSYLGTVTDEFLAFVRDVAGEKIAPTEMIWNEETMSKYTEGR